MKPDSPQFDPESLGAVLEEALAEQFAIEVARLRLHLKRDRLQELSRRILGNATLASGVHTGPRPKTGPFLATDGEFEAHDYLHLVSQEIRRALGQFVTPTPIVRYILRAARYRENEEILERRLCDPACGSGVFLVEAVRIYLDALRRAGIPTEQWYPQIRERFFGIDVDPVACLYARFNLGLLLIQPLLFWMIANPRRFPESLPIHHLDTLATLAAERSIPGFLENGASVPPLSGTFDFVVGNPPYRKLGQMPLALREAFEDSIYGHPNAYGLFIHAGIEMLRPGGRLGFIVPRSMLSGLYFQNLRRMIEQRTRFEELSLLSDRKKVFPQVLQGTMIVVFRRPEPKEEAVEAGRERVRTAVVRTVAELEKDGPAHLRVDSSRVARRLNGTTVWFVSDRERTYSILDKILGHHHPLLGGPGIGCPARTGPVVWNRVKPYLRPEGGTGTLPLVWATDVGRFRFGFGTAADSRPAFLEETSKTRSLTTTGPSVLVQRVTADEQVRRIVASLAAFSARRRYFVENHLNVLQPVKMATIDLNYLLGVLSSDVVEFLFRSMNGNTQVSATELNLLPIPRGRFEAKIAEVTAQLEDVRADACDDLHQELNERVARAYDLTGKELSFLRERLSERFSA